MAKGEPKSVNKSIRISEAVFSLITQYEGEGFNNKIENIVLDLPEREEKVKMLDRQIQEKQKQLKKIEQHINDLGTLEFSLDEVKRAIIRTNQLVNNVSCISKGFD